MAEYRNATSSAVFIEIACLVKKHDAYILRGTVHRLEGTAEGKYEHLEKILRGRRYNKSNRVRQ